MAPTACSPSFPPLMKFCGFYHYSLCSPNRAHFYTYMRMHYCAHPSQIPIFLKLRSTHHGLACSLQCLSFMPLPIQIPFYKESLSPDWQFLTLYTLSKLVMTEWHNAAWLLQPFCIFATMHNHCKFYSSSTMTFNDLTEHQEPHTFPTLLPLTATVGFGSILCIIYYSTSPRSCFFLALFLYEKPLHGSFHSLSIPSFNFKPFFCSANLASCCPTDHHLFTALVYITAKVHSMSLIAKQWFFRGQHLLIWMKIIWDEANHLWMCTNHPRSTRSF